MSGMSVRASRGVVASRAVAVLVAALMGGPRRRAARRPHARTPSKSARQSPAKQSRRSPSLPVRVEPVRAPIPQVPDQKPAARPVEAPDLALPVATPAVEPVAERPVAESPVATAADVPTPSTPGITCHPDVVVSLAIYLVAIVIAELCLAWQAPYASLLIHLALMVLLPIHAASTSGAFSHFLIAMVLAPLIRVVSLGLPLASVAPVQAYALACLPLFVGIISTVRAVSLSKGQIGLSTAKLPWQFVIGLTGIPFGFLEYAVLRPEPIADINRPLAVIWATLVLFIATGLLEELIFRGILQTTVLGLLGTPGLLYVNLIFAALHIGYQSPLDVVVVFGIGAIFSSFVLLTRSIVGVSIAHGLTNTLLFVVLPAYWPLH